MVLYVLLERQLESRRLLEMTFSDPLLPPNSLSGSLENKSYVSSHGYRMPFQPCPAAGVCSWNSEASNVIGIMFLALRQ